MNFFENVLNFLYPQTCGICEKISKEPICKHCKLKLDKITFPNRKKLMEFIMMSICIYLNMKG